MIIQLLSMNLGKENESLLPHYIASLHSAPVVHAYVAMHAYVAALAYAAHSHSAHKI